MRMVAGTTNYPYTLFRLILVAKRFFFFLILTLSRR
jgi:hypothetical protein